MINLKTDTDYLKRLAADQREDGRGLTADDIASAADDIEALKGYVQRLKNHTDDLGSEIDRLRKERDARTLALADFLRPVIGDMVSEAVEDSSAIDELEDRIRRLEDDEPDDEQVRAAVRSMISDGEIVVNIDHM